LHARTYRLDGHTIFDPAAYRSSEELTKRRQRDPIALLEAQLLEAGVPAARIEAIHADARTEMDRAVEFARNAPSPVAADAFDDVQLIGAPR
jgi:pyruvate dehydrogenase E1 component alpha subunit